MAARRVASASRDLSRTFGVSLRAIGEEIMTDVKSSRAGHGVPVDTGALRSTGLVEGPEVTSTPRVTLSFGGPAAPYALAQHERLDYQHRVGEPRYLVRGLERWKATGSAAMTALRAQARLVMGRGR
jgi:hypothetical protein